MPAGRAVRGGGGTLAAVNEAFEGHQEHATQMQRRALAELRALARASGSGFFLGNSPAGPVFAPPQHGLLVLGPPRSGKTTSLVVPNVLAAHGAVLTTSTKPDVLAATSPARRLTGRCLLFDPSGSVVAPPGVETVGWSPLSRAADFDEALLVSRTMTGAARPGSEHGESAHWTERAGMLVACLLHAAALNGDRITALVSAVNRHDLGRALACLDEHGAEGPFDSLSGIAATDSREQSGIWSTAASVLAAYQSGGALQSALRPCIDADAVIARAETVYVVSPSDTQRHAAALVAGLVHDLRRAAYAASRENAGTAAVGQRLVLVLDEVANIAPLQELPHLAAEGAGQGVLTMACLQDLSQARARWGPIADGFFSLFGTKVILPGIADGATLRAVSLLAGEQDVPRFGVSRQSGRRRAGRSETRSLSWQRQQILEPSAIGRGRGGEALTLFGTVPYRLALVPYHSSSPWKEAAGGLAGPPDAARRGPGDGSSSPRPAWPRRRPGAERRLER